MATIAAGPDIERLQIGRVFSRATGALQRNWLLLIGMSVFFALISNAINYFVLRDALAGGAGGPLGLFRNPVYWLNLLWSVISGFLLYGAIVHATVLDLGGTPPRLGPVLSVGLRSLLPLIGLAIITYFAVTFAMILFIVPAFLLLVRWSVAVPALVEERLGVFASLKRSNALTRGSRWRIFALFLIVFLVLAIPVALSFTAVGLTGMAQANQHISPSLIVFGLVGAIVNSVALAILASCYVELRYVKDGIAPDRLAEMFA